jgi:hypothetical protein
MLIDAYGTARLAAKGKRGAGPPATAWTSRRGAVEQRRPWTGRLLGE